MHHQIQSARDTPARLWVFWILAILAAPCAALGVIAANHDWVRHAFFIAYLIILVISLIVMERRAEARRGSWEWFVETVERGVPLSMLGAISSTLVLIVIYLALLFRYGS
jgi:hypothetical protein